MYYIHICKHTRAGLFVSVCHTAFPQCITKVFRITSSKSGGAPRTDPNKQRAGGRWQRAGRGTSERERNDRVKLLGKQISNWCVPELLLPALCTWLHVATTRQLLLYDKYEFVPPSLCVCVCVVSGMNKAFPNSNRVMSATHFPGETMTDVNQRATSCITPAAAPTGGGRQEIFPAGLPHATKYAIFI